MKREPPIFANRPAWIGLKEISRTDTLVRFKTRTGMIVVPIAAVEREMERK